MCSTSCQLALCGFSLARTKTREPGNCARNFQGLSLFGFFCVTSLRLLASVVWCMLAYHCVLWSEFETYEWLMCHACMSQRFAALFAQSRLVWCQSMACSTRVNDSPIILAVTFLSTLHLTLLTESTDNKTFRFENLPTKANGKGITFHELDLSFPNFLVDNQVGRCWHLRTTSILNWERWL